MDAGEELGACGGASGSCMLFQPFCCPKALPVPPVHKSEHALLLLHCITFSLPVFAGSLSAARPGKCQKLASNAAH